MEKIEIEINRKITAHLYREILTKKCTIDYYYHTFLMTSLKDFRKDDLIKEMSIELKCGKRSINMLFERHEIGGYHTRKFLYYLSIEGVNYKFTTMEAGFRYYVNRFLAFVKEDNFKKGGENAND